jgi:hypothetical protein
VGLKNLEQQKRFRADLSAKEALNLAKVRKSFETKLHFKCRHRLQAEALNPAWV